MSDVFVPDGSGSLYHLRVLTGLHAFELMQRSGDDTVTFLVQYPGKEPEQVTYDANGQVDGPSVDEQLAEWKAHVDQRAEKEAEKELAERVGW